MVTARTGLVRHQRIDRLSPGDLMSLAVDVGPVAANVTAVLELEHAPGRSSRADRAEPSDRGPAGELAELRALLADRVRLIPRLSQRLRTLAPGLGRPIWVEDETFDPLDHIELRRCPPPGDRQALLALAADVAREALPRDRPLWRGVLVDGLGEGRVALVMVVHHVVTDGLGGMAALLTLADSAVDSTTDPIEAPAPGPPTARDLVRENVLTRCRAVAELPRSVHRLAQARSELGAGSGRSRERRPRAARCSLNVPVSGQLRAAVLEVELAPLTSAAHAHGATVNDLLLVAVTSSLEAVLVARGEDVPALVVSVPISARVTATRSDLGNQVGVMPVPVPLTGTPHERIAEVARRTSVQKRNARGASVAVLGPAFRVLARLGVLRGFIERQRLINTILSNLRGPAEPVSIGGARVSAVIPVTSLAGNVPVAFTALSYAGRLVISVMHDPVRVPDAERIVQALSDSLADLVG